MNVYTYYNDAAYAPEQQARMIKLWAQSWSKHGWTPRLLTRRMAETQGGTSKRWLRPLVAVAHFGKTGLVTPSNVMNFGLKPTRELGKNPRVIGHGCFWLTRDSILQFKRAKRYANFSIDLKYDYFGVSNGDQSLMPMAPLIVFPSHDPMEVLEHPRWR